MATPPVRRKRKCSLEIYFLNSAKRVQSRKDSNNLSFSKRERQMLE